VKWVPLKKAILLNTDQASSKASMQKGGTKNTERPAGDGRRFGFISWVNLHEDYMCFGGNVRKLRNHFQRGSQQNQTDRMYHCQQVHVLATAITVQSFCGKVRKHFVLIYELFLSSMIG
jgi:hypothetical protein